MTFAESTNEKAQPYKYNGKELDQMHGLNWSDYEARWKAEWYLPTADPHAENYYSWSPYHYAGNNPILNIDPDGRDYWSTNDPELIKRFLNSMGNSASVADMSGWNHARDAEFLGRGTLNDETGKFYTSYGTVENGVYTQVGVSFDTNIKPGLTADGYGYKGAFAYGYNNDFPSFLGPNFGGRLYTDAYNLVQRGIFSSMYADEYYFDPTYYDDGTTQWGVNTAGRITGKYEESDMPLVPIGIGKGGGLGFKVHRKGKNWQKHSAPRAGGDPASGRYGQSRNKSRGDSNKKYIPPSNPNKRK